MACRGCHKYGLQWLFGQAVPGLELNPLLVPHLTDVLVDIVLGMDYSFDLKQINELSLRIMANDSIFIVLWVKVIWIVNSLR